LALPFLLVGLILCFLPSRAQAVCNVAGEWQHTTNSIGTATWTFTLIGSNRYSAQERGLGNATGTAVMTGSRLRVDWRTGGYSGIYEWAIDAGCANGQGQLTFLSGRSGAFGSALKRLSTAQQQATGGYWARWVKTSGSGAPWASPWAWYGPEYIQAYGRTVCGHGSTCSCPGQRNYCGTYAVGSETTAWPYGCKKATWTLRCEVYRQ
jgi:hypothetical protein